MENKEIVFETHKDVVFDPETNEFVHLDGGRQKVYSNLVYYPADNKRLWNPNVIDPKLKQQALEHCLGLSLGPQPYRVSERTEAFPEQNCKQSDSVFPRSSSENNSLSCNF